MTGRPSQLSNFAGLGFMAVGLFLFWVPFPGPPVGIQLALVGGGIVISRLRAKARVLNASRDAEARRLKEAAEARPIPAFIAAAIARTGRLPEIVPLSQAYIDAAKARAAEPIPSFLAAAIGQATGIRS